MKLRFVTVALIACVWISGYSQKLNYINYHNSVNKAEYFLYTKQKIEEAKLLYLQAFSGVPQPLARDCYMLARCYAKLDDFDSAWIFLEKSSNTSIIFIKPSEIIVQDTFYFEKLLIDHPEVVNPPLSPLAIVGYPSPVN